MVAAIKITVVGGSYKISEVFLSSYRRRCKQYTLNRLPIFDISYLGIDAEKELNIYTESFSVANAALIFYERLLHIFNLFWHKYQY